MEENKNILKAPLVVVQKIEDGKPTYFGFVPGLTKKDVICKTKAECEAKLKEVALAEIKTIIKEKKTFPYFPDSKEIIGDFENVVSIKYITIHL